MPGRSRTERDDSDNEYYEVSAMCWTAVGNSHGNFPRPDKQRIQSLQLEPEIESELKSVMRISSV